MTERERLIEELAQVLCPEDPIIPDFAIKNMERLADWVISDRKRIVAPLTEFKLNSNWTYQEKFNAIAKAIEQVAKNAGVL